MMKKLQLIIFLFIAIGIFSQSQQINFGDLPRPVPSTSYNVTYQEMPMSTATGVPDISIPLGGIFSQGNQISENLTLSYNPYNVNNEDFVSEVGLGWSLFSGGSISRQIAGELDELYDNASASNYNVNAFDDLYYYNLPNGVSGKFKINRDIATNTFTIVNYDRNSMKIEFTRSGNTATLIINSFTVTDDKGFKFIFNDFSQSIYTTGNRWYKSAFYITSIKNASGNELLTYEYNKNNQYIPGTSILLYQNCKLKKINSAGLGYIDIEYGYDSSLNNSLNDPYNISKIKAQNYYGKDLFEYNFEYSLKNFSTLNNQKRVLDKITKKNFENPNSPETTRFEYNTAGLDDNITIPNFTGISCTDYSEVNAYPANSVVGILKKIHLPTGGAVEYEFEPNGYFFDKNTPDYLQSLQEMYIDPTVQSINHITDVNYSNTNTATLQFWNLQGDPTKQKRIYFVFNASRNIDNPFEPTNPGYFSASFKIDGNNPATSPCGPAYSDENTFSSTSSMLLSPGYHTIEFPGIYVNGSLAIFELVNNPQPYKNINYTNGVRIKKIKHFNSSASSTPDKVISYSYNLFDDSKSSSGYKFANENAYSSSEFVLYKNVRISNGEDMGYTDNYFKLPSDYADTHMNIGGTTQAVKNFYNLTQSGLIYKKSIFNNSNNKVKELVYEYELEQRTGVTEIAAGYGYMRPGVIRKFKEQDMDFLDNQSTIVNTKESNFENRFRFNGVSSTKQTLSDGTVIEKIFNYPNPLTLVGQVNEFQHLIDNNITGIPIQIIEKKNGTVVSTADTKFDNNSLYPTSVKTTNPYDGSVKTAIRYDRYDNKGNLLQYTTNIDENTGAGFPTTLLYGYNQSLTIAKVEGATFDDLKFILIPPGSQGIVARSDQDVDEASEKLLLEELDEYRDNSQLKNFMMTTYTYDPLIGVTSITPPNGIREIYKYDINGKLKMAVDVNGNILNEYKYNVKPQP